MGSNSVLFSDSFTTMVHELGLQAESDFEVSQSQEDGQSQASISTVTFSGRTPKIVSEKTFT